MNRRVFKKKLLNKYYKRTNRPNKFNNELEKAESNSLEQELSSTSDSEEIFIEDVSTMNTDDPCFVQQVHEDFQNLGKSDSSSSEDDVYHTSEKGHNEFLFELGNWAVKHNIPHSAVTDLNNIVSINLGTKLPKDSRTLLRTPRNVGKYLKAVNPGQYYHFGFKNCLEKCIKASRRVLNKTNLMEVCINIDGLPLSNSSGSQLWPIMCSLFNNKNVVHVIGVYQGNEKPENANMFLEEFVMEATNILTNGFDFNGYRYDIKIKAFICDVPAKCFIKYTKGHSGYMSCSKCHIEGVFLENRICFPQVNNLILRNDLQFRSKEQENHHTGTSLLEMLPGVDMIENFPLDYMHLVCLGVVKKLIVNLWMSGKPRSKLSYQQITNISDLQLQYAKHIPKEFTRKPRSLKEAKRWKATEFRLFLFYMGPLVLKSVLSKDKYINFLCLHVAMTLLSNVKDSQDVDYANSLLKFFVETFISLYGSENVSHNVHNLLHICDDVQKFGSLENFSAFPFENHMIYFKKFVRKGNQPLQQIVCRINEFDTFNDGNILEETFPRLYEEHFKGPLLNFEISKQYKKIVFENFMLGISEPDNCCTMLNNCVIIRNIVSINEDIIIIGQNYCKLENFYTSPCNSSELGIYIISELGPLQAWNINKISYKCLKLEFDSKHIVFPMIHTK